MEDIAFSELNIMSSPLFQNSKPNPPIPGRSGLFCSVGLKMVAVWLPFYVLFASIPIFSLTNWFQSVCLPVCFCHPSPCRKLHQRDSRNSWRPTKISTLSLNASWWFSNLWLPIQKCNVIFAPWIYQLIIKILSEWYWFYFITFRKISLSWGVPLM